MSLSFLKPCRMSVSSMSHVEFKKWPCRPVEFRGLGPSEGRGQDWRGKGKGAIVSETCGHLGDQGGNEESPSSAEWPPPAATLYTDSNVL